MTAPISKLLKVYRATEDMAQFDLARQIGIPPETLCRIEQGKTGNQITTVKIISWMFGGKPCASK
jgi:DNA-binding XRE family transcriptional regulator